MKFYQDSHVTIYCGNSQELLPSLMGGRGIDLLICDPPYGMDYQSARRTGHQRSPKIQGDLSFPKWCTDFRGDIASFFFCRWDNLADLPKPKSFIVWDKCRHSMGDLEHEYGRQWEAIAFYAGVNHSFVRRPVDIIRVPCVPPCDLKHPNEKPVELINALILAHDAKTVIDPFCGSGSTLVAAKSLGLKAIGIDIDEKHCAMAAQRCRQNYLKL